MGKTLKTLYTLNHTNLILLHYKILIESRGQISFSPISHYNRPHGKVARPTCAFAAQANQDKKVFAYAGLSFACVYAVFINLVYFTQLTTVNQQAASKDVINALTYTPGSWIFALDIFGYGMMAISTFFVGLTILPKYRTDKWLKSMLMLHGLFAIGNIFPVFNMFNGTKDVDSVNNMGVIVLEGWSLFFIPIMMLAAKYFKVLR